MVLQEYKLDLLFDLTNLSSWTLQDNIIVLIDHIIIIYFHRLKYDHDTYRKMEGYLLYHGLSL